MRQFTRTDPTVTCVKLTDLYGKFLVEPLPRGYGTVLGTVLRRTLLSSISGAAVTMVKIDGVAHEFSTLPGVVEDMTELILNLKELAVRVLLEDSERSGARSWRARLEAEGEGEVTGADIIVPSDLQIVNPELHLATLTQDDARLCMELTIAEGLGYVPAEEQDLSTQVLGTIPVDSIFSPVRQVNHRVEATRGDDHTEYDRLILEIVTNGAVGPNKALSQAAHILDGYYRLFFNFRETASPTERDRLEETLEPVDEWTHCKIEDLEFSVRTYNCLKKENINTVGDLLRLTEAELTSIRNFGRKSLAEVISKLEERNLSLRGGMSSKEALGKD